MARRDYRPGSSGERILADAEFRVSIVKRKAVYFILIDRIQINDHRILPRKLYRMFHLALQKLLVVLRLQVMRQHIL